MRRSKTANAEVSRRQAPGDAQSAGFSLQPAYKYRRLKFTRDGWYYFFFTIGVGIAALNTGNNLLFLVLGLQLTAILVSGILSENALRQLSIDRDPIVDPTAGDPFVVSYRVRNPNRFWPSFTLTIAEKDGPFTEGRARLLCVDAGKTARVSMDASADRRGLHGLRRIVLSTRFPFGFFEKARELDVPGEVWVLPRRVPAEERRARGGYREGVQLDGRPGHGAEFLGFRELQPGDDRRAVHWRKSASLGRLVAVERERERSRRVTIVLDNRGPAGGDWLDGPVERAAAAARLLSQRGLEIGLATSGERIEPGPGPAALRRVLRALAVLAPKPREAAAPDAGREGVLVFSRAAAPRAEAAP